MLVSATHIFLVLTTAAEFEMLSLMARLSMGWTLSSSFNAVDSTVLKQLNVLVGAVSVIEVRIMYSRLVKPDSQ